ncbi:hypothetical protein [Herbaspirillum huttiense]|uniref:hypothetical protein n=1 Tax=Herbaspirillum huttiense TaxID=863372 RepID=UPI001E52EBB2|nr:hypothetical protein [Herbaspirillum huttiense]
MLVAEQPAALADVEAGAGAALGQHRYHPLAQLADHLGHLAARLGCGQIVDAHRQTRNGLVDRTARTRTRSGGLGGWQDTGIGGRRRPVVRGLQGQREGRIGQQIADAHAEGFGHDGRRSPFQAGLARLEHAFADGLESDLALLRREHLPFQPEIGLAGPGTIALGAEIGQQLRHDPAHLQRLLCLAGSGIIRFFLEQRRLFRSGKGIAMLLQFATETRQHHPGR